MESMDLKLKYNVDNKLTGEGDLGVDMDVKNMDSFKPENVAKNVPALSKMLAARNLLKDLKSNLLDNREFRKRLELIIKDPSAVKSLQEELKKVVPETKDPDRPKK
jgi:type VI secretion system protein ImpB